MVGQYQEYVSEENVIFNHPAYTLLVGRLVPNSTSVVHENLVSANFELSCLIFLDEVAEHEDNVAETLQVSADFTQTLAKSTAFPLILQVSISSMLIKNVFTVVFMSFNKST